MNSEILTQQQLTDAIALLNKHEQATNCEMAILYGAKGQLVDQTDGNNDTTYLSPVSLIRANGGILIHNHPDNAGSFSMEDLFCCGAHGLKEVWACNKDGSLFKAHGMLPTRNNMLLCSIAKPIFELPFQAVYNQHLFNENEVCDILGHAWNLVFLQKGLIDCYEWSFGAANKAVIAKFRELAKPGQPLEGVGKVLNVFSNKWD